MNKVFLTGRTTTNPELKATESGQNICRFTLAVNRNFKNSKGEYETDFISCVAFRQRAELICEYVNKGDLIGICGRIQTGSYTAQDGNKRYTTDVIVENVEFLRNKRNEPEENLQETNTTTSEQTDPFADFGAEVNIDDNFLD